MANRVPVSFKENERDNRLYKYVIKENDKSCFIKNAIEYYIDSINLKKVSSISNISISTNNDFEDDNDEGIGEIMGL